MVLRHVTCILLQIFLPAVWTCYGRCMSLLALWIKVLMISSLSSIIRCFLITNVQQIFVCKHVLKHFLSNRWSHLTDKGVKKFWTSMWPRSSCLWHLMWILTWSLRQQLDLLGMESSLLTSPFTRQASLSGRNRKSIFVLYTNIVFFWCSIKVLTFGPYEYVLKFNEIWFKFWISLFIL